MTRRRAAVYAALAGLAWWGWRGDPPFPVAAGSLVIHTHRGRRQRPEPVRSGPPEEALP